MGAVFNITKKCLAKQSETSRFGVFFATIIFSLSSCSDSSNKQSAFVATPIVRDSLLTPSQLLGKKLFFDTNLSNPSGQSCAGCHIPEKGFSDQESKPVSSGAIKTRFGNRNAPSVSYAAFTPYFHYDSTEASYIGGLFWDGRSKTLSEQAMNPFLNHLEMNNSSKKKVVDKVRTSEYTDLFLYVFGPNAFDNTEIAFESITESIEEYEESKEISPFTSKFDYFLKGQIQLSEAEQRGLKLFIDSAKGNCATCHPSTVNKISGVVLFTDFTYDNLGIPVNCNVKDLCKDYKTDLGLGAIVNKTSENGKFKVPTLRNIAKTSPYFHNGIYKTLEEVMDFYNNRDKNKKIGSAEVQENLNRKELGNLKLTDQEVKDIIAFMNTLSDGYINR